jgi:DNA-binding response OmpR family regulator
MEAARASTLLSIEPAPRILIVEDDLDLAGRMDAVLRRYGFQTEVVGTRTAALDRVSGVDLVLLDLSLPDGDALEICARLAARGGLVVISEHGGEADRVAALELGADDYMTKPFPFRELVARCRAVLRRTSTTVKGSVVQVGELEIDIERYEARCRRCPLELTTKELAVLVALARRIGTLVRREDLAREVWGAGIWSVNQSLDVHISSLRRKLGDSPHQPRYIQTVHGLGFRLLPQTSATEEPTAQPSGPRDAA